MVDIVLVLAIIVPLVIVLYALLSSLRIVRPTEKGLVERFGKYHRLLKAA
jgi:regulator of protease activity HflC (stomatin/prohibitin superfamily)